jgi:hypothetical protein
MGPATGVVDEDHQGNSSTTENVERIKALLHEGKVRRIVVGALTSDGLIRHVYSTDFVIAEQIEQIKKEVMRALSVRAISQRRKYT